MTGETVSHYRVLEKLGQKSRIVVVLCFAAELKRLSAEAKSK